MELWFKGVDTFDASMNQTFKMHSALMWKISDFLGLSTLLSQNTYTGLACPTCNFDATPLRLPYIKKWCFQGHHCFLGEKHRFLFM